MKRIFIIITICTFCLTNQAQWTQQSSGTNSNLQSVCFIDSNNGWAVGTEGIILHTDNGGETWQLQSSPTNINLNKVHFFNQDIGWISGAENIQGPSAIIRTIDGGNNWNIVYSDSTSALSDIQFVDSLNGWVLNSLQIAWSEIVILLHSMDGGQTWFNPLNYPGVGCIYFVDELNGWGGGGYYSGSSGYSRCNINYSDDGGNNWTTQFDSVDMGVIYNVFFTDLFNGWAAGGNHGAGITPPHSTIIHTADGGLTWLSQNSLSDRVLNDIFFVDSLSGWSVGGWTLVGWVPDTSVILHTSNGGEDWEYQSCPVTQELNSVCFPDPEHGWIVGDSGTILFLESSSQGLDYPDNDVIISIYPNPFTGKTTFSISLDEPTQVNLVVMDRLGREVVTVLDESLPQGSYNLTWNAERAPSGIYFYRLAAGNQTSTGKLVVVR